MSAANSADLTSLIEKQNLLLQKIVEELFKQTGLESFYQTIIGGVIAAAVGGLVAFLLSWAHQHTISRLAKRTEIIEKIKRIVENIEETSIKHFSRHYDEAQDQEDIIKITISFAQLNRLNILYAKQINVSPTQANETTKLIGILFDEATGGDYGSKARIPNLSASKKIVKASNRLIREIDP